MVGGPGTTTPEIIGGPSTTAPVIE